MLLESCCFPPDPQRLAALAVPGVDPEAFARLADEHGVLARVAAALKGAPGIAPALSEAVKERLRPALVRNLTLVAELFRVLDLLGPPRLTPLAIKGPVLAERAYGDSAARQFGDVDLLLPHAQLPEAAGRLATAGYRCPIPPEAIRAGRTPGQYLFRRAGTDALVELHTERTLRYFPRPLPIAEFLARRTAVTFDGRSIPALGTEDEFVLISIHGSKHFWERLMWISDVAALAGRRQLDWGRVRQSAAALGAGRMVRVALRLAERLLRAEVPEAMKNEVARDRACGPMAEKTASWLPYAGHAPLGLIERSLYRVRSRGSFLAGAGYLARLALSPTEEDWSPGAPGRRAVEILGRPLRLARKYRRTGDPPGGPPI